MKNNRKRNHKDRKKRFSNERVPNERIQDNRDDLIFGVNPVKEAIISGTSIKEIFLGSKDLIPSSMLKGIKVKIIDPQKLKKLYGDNTQNVVALIAPFEYTAIEDLLRGCAERSTLVILDHITDPHNLGAIIRSCDASGVDGIIIPDKRSAQINATVFKTSAGAVNHIRIAKVSNLINAINLVKEKGFWVYGAEADGDSDLFETKVDGRVVVVMGSEGKGLSRLVRDNLDFVLNIPMAGNVNSLNVSVATAVILFEFFRKRIKNEEKARK